MRPLDGVGSPRWRELAAGPRDGASVLVGDPTAYGVAEIDHARIAQVLDEAGRQGYAVESVPGPSPLVAALAISGLAGAGPHGQSGFVVDGPWGSGREGSLRGLLDGFVERCASLDVPLVVQLTGHGAADDGPTAAQILAALAERLPDRNAILVAGPPYVARQRAALAELTVGTLDPTTRLILVLAPAPPRPPDLSGAVGEVRALVADGVRLKDACREVSARTGISSKKLYAEAL